MNQSTDLSTINVRGFYYKDHFDHLVEGMANSAVSKPNTGITPVGYYCLTYIKKEGKAYGHVSISTGKEINKPVFTDYDLNHTITEAKVISGIVEIPVDMLTYRSQSLPNTMVSAAIEYILINS